MRPNTLRSLAAILFIIATAGQTRFAGAQDPEPEYVPDGVQMSETFDSGWDYVLRIDLSTAFANSSSVIGNADGTTWTVGFSLESAINYMRNYHEVRNTLNLGETFTRTPLVDEFVKSGDLVELESIYFYHIPAAPWFGPFARFRLSTSVFAGTDVRPGDVTYTITRPDGSIDSVVSSRLDTTDPFLPFLIKLSTGAFLRPVTPPDLQFEFLLGFGMRQVFADDQLAVNDDDDTDAIEIVELQTFFQAGAEAVATVWGELVEGRVGYEAGAEVMMPFINDLTAGDDRGVIDLTNIDLYASVSVRIVDWASIEYQFRAIREPQLLDEFQVQNNLLFSIGYTLLEQAPSAPPAEATETAEATE